jgi:chromate transporter
MVSFHDAFRVWLKIGLLGFGGPAGQIALMHRILVDEKRWIGESRFLHALNYCMLLPGPEAQQLATYIGWLLHRTWGGIVAGVLFVLPGALVILLLSILYAGFQQLPVVQALFFGIKAAVLAVVVESLVRIGKRALKTRALYGVAAAAFIALFFFDVPFPVVVLAAGLLGLLGGDVFAPAAAQDTKGDAPAVDSLLEAGDLAHTRPSFRRAITVLVVSLALWFAPVGVAAWLAGADSSFVDIGLFFSKMAVVTFGGAYAVLAYVAQQGVDVYQWLTAGEMLDGLGLAETTPGPLVLVLEFVGFLAAYRNPTGLDPMVAGALGAALTVWVTFTPSFLWIFLGGPYVESLRGNRALAAALAAITGAVVGVILNLALWFAAHVLFARVDEATFGPVTLLSPVWSTLEPVSLLLAVAALVAMLRYKVGMVTVLALSALAGAAYRLLVV